MPGDLLRCRGAILALGAPALLAGCGGGATETAQIRAVAQRYERALKPLDGRALCSVLSDEAQREVARLAAEATPKLHGCVAFWDSLAANDPNSSSHLSVASIGRVKAVGSAATVQLVRPGERAAQLTLVKTPAGWRITRAPPVLVIK